jgi:hypothetical protein
MVLFAQILKPHGDSRKLEVQFLLETASVLWDWDANNFLAKKKTRTSLHMTEMT